MARLADLPPLRETADRHGLLARRALGQNFLFDDNLLDRIVRAAQPLDGAEVLEIGPGPGGLTRAALRAGAGRVVALEKDTRCVAALGELAEASGGRLEVVAADALEADLGALARGRVVLGNLPFNVATEILVRLAEAGGSRHMVLMFQKEVAQRIAAAPGGRDWGRLGVMVQWRCDVRRCFDVPARAFVPAPKVSATVLRLEPLAAPRFPADPAALRRVAGAAFGQRRKTLRNALGALVEDPAALLAAAGIDPGLRAERLTLEDFCRLARAYAGPM
jgi:16S rRNA (adenine1518-N6/adenine1519-N6)-dimethyltransferase